MWSRPLRSLLTAGLVLALTAPAQAFTLSGSVLSGGSGVYPCDIDVHDRDTGVLIPTAGDTTLPNGSYAIDLANGRYRVRFQPPVSSHLMPVEFPDVQISNAPQSLSVALGPAQWMSGRVVDAGVNGVEAVNLNFHDATGNTPDEVFGDKSDPDGFFLTAVTPGVWDVDLIPPVATRLVPAQVPGVDASASDPDIGTVTVNAGWIVTATVTDLGFFPIFDADLDVRPSSGGAKLFTPQDNTDISGVATIVLPPGTYDIVASPPPLGPSYATRTARGILVDSDTALPNLALPPGFGLTAACRTPALAPLAGVDLDVDSLPALGRLETATDISDATGAIATVVSDWKFRVTLSPPVASRLLPVRLDSVQVNGTALDLGTIVFPQGHWVTVYVQAAGAGTPIEGANLDFIRVSTGEVAITIDDVTDATGQATVTTDVDLYRLRVTPPAAAYDTLVLENVRTLGDTTMVVELVPATAGIAGPAGAGGLSLSPPWPQPGRETVHLAFTIGSGTADLEIVDLTGRRIAILDRAIPAGTHIRTWDGRTLSGAAAPAGMYFVRLSATGPTRQVVRKITRIR